MARLRVIKNVPHAAMREYRDRADAAGATLADIISWCVSVLGCPPARNSPRGRFYWCLSLQEKERIEITTRWVSKRKTPVVTLKLSDEANAALDAASQLYRCSEGEVLAYAADLAPYFGRKDGNLAHGWVLGGKKCGLSKLVTFPNRN